MNTSENQSKSSAINAVFIAFIAAAIIFSAFTGNIKDISDSSFSAAKNAVTLAIGLIGIMALWLGFMRVLEAGGLMRSLARLLKPIMARLFPDVPAEHPAMSAMILNISANMLGLGNAATPFGIKAMNELDKLNPIKGTATNAMCLFLAINTSSVALLPLGVIGVRAAANCLEPAAIFLPTLIATSLSTIVGISVACFLAGRDAKYTDEASLKEHEALSTESSGVESNLLDPDYSHLLYPTGLISRLMAWLLLVIFVIAIIYNGLLSNNPLDFLVNDVTTHWLMPALMLLIIAYGLGRGVKIYEAVTEGAKQGFEIAVRIIPFLVAILVAIAMFRASGAMELCQTLIEPITGVIGMPPDVLPMALVRPLSGSGAFGVMSALVEADPNSYSAYVASTMMGSTETTFYVLAVYFGSVGIVRIRHALIAALLADFTGIVAASLASRFFWNS